MTAAASTVSQPATGWRQLIDPNTASPWNPTPGPGMRNDYSIPAPVGTPIVAPVSGVVLPQHTSGGGYYSYYGSQPWGGEVDLLTSMADYPNGLQNVNILHFDTINVQPGDTVIAGQTVLGTSGGQTSGGHMPSSPTYSTGPHIGIGVHSVQSWDTMWNPQTLINNLMSGQNMSAVPSNNQIQGAGLGGIPLRSNLAGGNEVTGHDHTTPHANAPRTNTSPCDQYNVLDPRHWFCTFTTGSWPLRIGKMVLGVAMVTTGVLLFLVGSLGSDIAAAAVTAAGVPEAAPFAARAAGRRTKLTRRVGAGIRTQGALQGKETLKATEQKGVAKGTVETRQAFHEAASDAAKRGWVTRRAKEGKEEEPPQAPLPKGSTLVYASSKEKEPFAYQHGGVLYNLQTREAIGVPGESAPQAPAGRTYMRRQVSDEEGTSALQRGGEALEAWRRGEVQAPPSGYEVAIREAEKNRGRQGKRKRGK